MQTIRPSSYGICGGAYGDEGKGRIVDELVHELSLKGNVVVYRDNGGANAGHTVEFPTGERVALHQLPSGVFVKGATVVLGKEMVVHPEDLLSEIEQISRVKATLDRAQIKIDELVILSLDTHRAYEAVLKDWQEGSKGSTGRGIAPAYADVILRQPLRMRDVIAGNRKKIEAHYNLYAALITGLGHELATTLVPRLTGEAVMVGTCAEFTSKLLAQADQLGQYVSDLRDWISEKWNDPKCAFVFEKAQAIGLDTRWGVYPDVTASDTTFGGIFSATEGVIDPDRFQIKAGVIKATYMSSVGARRLPTLVTGELAERIRKDAHEYGATTKRPRDIAFLDLPALKYFARVGHCSSLILTHMDVVYPDHPVKICTEYRVNGKVEAYHPDQQFLDKVEPVYEELKSWDIKKLAAAKTYQELPIEAQQFLTFISKEIGVPIVMITTGPQREQGIRLAIF